MQVYFAIFTGGTIPITGAFDRLSAGCGDLWKCQPNGMPWSSFLRPCEVYGRLNNLLLHAHQTLLVWYAGEGHSPVGSSFSILQHNKSSLLFWLLEVEGLDLSCKTPVSLSRLRNCSDSTSNCGAFGKRNKYFSSIIIDMPGPPNWHLTLTTECRCCVKYWGSTKHKKGSSYFLS